MNRSIACIAALMIAHVSAAATLTADPLTGLPLDPATNSRLNLGNEPTKMATSSICKCTMDANLYTVYAPVDETVAWYSAHLKNFKHAHAYSSGRSRDTFYNSAGTVVVTVTGEKGKDGENVDTHAVMYYRLQPAIAEKSILAWLHEKVVCS